MTTVLDGSFPFELLNISSCAPVELSFRLPTKRDFWYFHVEVLFHLFSSPTKPSYRYLSLHYRNICLASPCRSTELWYSHHSLLALPSPQRNNFRTDWRLVWISEVCFILAYWASGRRVPSITDNRYHPRQGISPYLLSSYRSRKSLS